MRLPSEPLALYGAAPKGGGGNGVAGGSEEESVGFRVASVRWVSGMGGGERGDFSNTIGPTSGRSKSRHSEQESGAGMQESGGNEDEGARAPFSRDPKGSASRGGRETAAEFGKNAAKHGGMRGLSATYTFGGR
jgi:hypothetical protein